MTDTATEGNRFAFQVPVRLYGPNVITPKAADYGGGKMGAVEYSVNLFFPPSHPEAKAFGVKLAQVKDRQFGSGAKGVALPFRMGDAWADAWAKKHHKEIAEGKKNPRDFARGMVMVKASSKNFPPMLSYVNNGQLVDIPEEARVAAGGKFYSGVEAFVEINLVPYAGNGAEPPAVVIPDSVKAYLTKVCSLGRGERLGGGSSASTFGNAVRSLGTVSDDDPTDGTGSKEIPF
jgi:hypothetical protein